MTSSTRRLTSSSTAAWAGGAKPKHSSPASARASSFFLIAMILSSVGLSVRPSAPAVLYLFRPNFTRWRRILQGFRPIRNGIVTESAGEDLRPPLSVSKKMLCIFFEKGFASLCASVVRPWAHNSTLAPRKVFFPVGRPKAGLALKAPPCGASRRTRREQSDWIFLPPACGKLSWGRQRRL